MSGVDKIKNYDLITAIAAVIEPDWWCEGKNWKADTGSKWSEGADFDLWRIEWVSEELFRWKLREITQ